MKRTQRRMQLQDKHLIDGIQGKARNITECHENHRRNQIIKSKQTKKNNMVALY